MGELVVTLGPSAPPENAHIYRDLGATAFRLNASHMSPRAMEKAVQEVRRNDPKTEIVCDLQGGKMRLAHFEEVQITRGQEVWITLQDAPLAEQPPSGIPVIPVNHSELFGSMAVNDTVSIGDAAVRLKVLRFGPQFCVCKSLSVGTLGSRKGLFIVEHPAKMKKLSDVDVQHIRVLKNFSNISFAYSFMLDGEEATWIRDEYSQDNALLEKKAASVGSRVKVIGKIERLEAVRNLEKIAKAVDAIWICRGDLGAQLGMVQLAVFIESFYPAKVKTSVLLAGQVLQHMVMRQSPTRSEVCHLFSMVKRDYGGIVLSDETAVGCDAQNVVRTAKQLLTEFRSKVTK